MDYYHVGFIQERGGVMVCLASFAVLFLQQAAALSLLLTIKMHPLLILFPTYHQPTIPTPFKYSFFVEGRRVS